MPYYLIIALQIFCIVHALRRGKEYGWIFFIVLIPIIGCIVYIITQMLNKTNMNTVQENLNTVINPGRKIKELEKKAKFSDTFENKIELADAYFADRQFEEAKELYISCLNGVFKDDTYANMQLGLTYFELGRYPQVEETLSKIKRHTEFRRSKAHLIFALAYEKLGYINQARTEFEDLNGTRSNIEYRYEYGLFLVRRNRAEQATELFEEIVGEVEFMDKNKKTREAAWIRKIQSELSQLKN